MRLRTPTSLAIAALALGSAGCGSDKLSKEDFVKKADAICADFEKKVEAVAEPTNVQNAGDAAAYLEKVSPIVDEGVGKLKDLQPPDDVKPDWDDYIEKQEEGAAIIKGAKDKAKAKDAAGLTDLQKLAPISKESKRLAIKAGAKGCAESESSG